MATEKKLHKFNQGLKLESANRYFQAKKKHILERVNLETYRLLKCLNTPISLKNLIIEQFINFWSTFNPGSKFRNLEKLLPMTIYYVLKSQKYPFNKKKLLNMFQITNKEFNTFLQIY